MSPNDGDRAVNHGATNVTTLHRLRPNPPLLDAGCEAGFRDRSCGPVSRRDLGPIAAQLDRRRELARRSPEAPRVYFTNRISEYFGSGQRWSATTRSSASAPVRTT